VGTQVSGVIEKLLVDFNSEVKKGQVLAKLDQTPLIAQLEQSKASVDQAQAEVNYQKANFERNKVLADKKLIAQSDFDLVVYNYEKAVASLKNARSVYEKNRINLAYATIYSPIDGIILDRAVDEGQTVAASFNTPTLFTIANDLTRMRVEASVDEADIGQVKMGQRTEFKVSAYPSRIFSGTVTEIRLQPVTTNNVVTYTVVVDAPNPDKELMPGMTADITIYTEEKSNILVVPGKATRFTPDQNLLEAYNAVHNLPTSGSNASVGAEPADLTTENAPASGNASNPGPALSSGNTPAADAPGSGSTPAPGNLSSPSGDKTLTAGQNLAEPVTGEVGYLWIQNGKELRRIRVVLGATDGINYELLSGAQEGDQLVVSLQELNSQATAKKEVPTASSPFMPQRPGANRTK
jgi:HlyD family secretion protein